jgi:AraC-like DNA-binding protein
MQLMDPVLAQTTGRFHRQVPSVRLQGGFASIWAHQMDAASAPPVIITPDATIDLQWIGGSFRVAGPDRDPQTETLSAGEIVIGFRFHPAAAAAWLGVPIVELVGERLPLEDLWGKRARHLASRVHVSDCLVDMLSSLESVVAGEAMSNELNARMRAAHVMIERGVPPDAPLVPYLMRALGMSERTLRRRFDENFGYGPKTLDRILRYQRFLRLSSRSRGTTAVHASEAGYADQAHLVRESRRLTGSTPRQVDRLLSGE